MSRVLLAGSTGLVGSHVAALLSNDPVITGPIVAPVRREPERKLERVVPVVTDLADASSDDALTETLRAAAGGGFDAYISCLGTTMKKAGSEPAFLAVDKVLVLRFATMARALGAKSAVVVSSVGADASSGNFYLRVKGDVERELGDMGFTRLDVMRPGLLLGPRNESRPGERLAQIMSPFLNPLLIGSLRRYRAIDAADVAAAVVELIKRGGSGRAMHEWEGIMELAGR